MVGVRFPAVAQRSTDGKTRPNAARLRYRQTAFTLRPVVALRRKPAQAGARRKSQQKGAAWERYVSEQWLTKLVGYNVLTVYHKLEPVKVGDRFTKDAGADFVGCLLSGHYLAIECKATDQERFKRSEISAVQAKHLDAVPLSFLALRIEQKAFFIPWRLVPWERVRTAESVRAESLGRWEVRSWVGVAEIIKHALRELDTDGDTQ